MEDLGERFASLEESIDQRIENASEQYNNLNEFALKLQKQQRINFNISNIYRGTNLEPKAEEKAGEGAEVPADKAFF